MSATRISEATLVRLRADGLSRRSSFVDPTVIAKVSRVLERRGERWAAAVLGRNIGRRSIAVTRRPYLHDGETYALVLADAEETRLEAEAVG